MSTALVAILAAGESRRMGAPKLCLPWGKTTVLGHLLSQWREVGAIRLLVVHPQAPDAPVVQELDRLKIPPAERIATSAPERGMMGSVVTAAALAVNDSSLSHLIIALGDQPHLRAEILRDLLQACQSNSGHLIRLISNGKPGHPLALPALLLPELGKASVPTLRDFLASHKTPTTDLTCADSGVLLDMDTPDDYARASSTVD